MNSDPSSDIHNRISEKAKLIVKATALAGTMALAACTSGSPTEAAPTTEATVSSNPAPESTTPLTPEQQAFQEAEAYILSTDRNIALQEAAQTTAAEIVEAAQTGEIGYFDFYNPGTDTWGRGAGNEGWGHLQHNPQYGGTESQVIATVYQNADGSFDLSKGVLEVSLSTGENPTTMIESPLYGKVMFGNEPLSEAWSTTIFPHLPEGAQGNSESASILDVYDHTGEELEAVDQSALQLLNQYMQELKLKD